MPLGARETTFTKSQRLTRVQEIAKFFKFLTFEISAGLIQILVFTLLASGLRVTYWVAYLPALIASVLWSFTANRHFTFKSVSNIPIAMLKVAFYYCLFTPLSTWWGDHLAMQHWPMSQQAQYYVILIGTMVVNFLTEFCVYRFWVYRKSINTSEAGQREQSRYANPYYDDTEVTLPLPARGIDLKS